ncbi:MAG: hypothetical protein KJ697_01365 [Nanoarchaeota archaeon]|nr:hypothetical protein [Nanoarchaeota archaeon]MBU4124053.1 hypothetical protein [Nanoarchaeota archaeon]
MKIDQNAITESISLAVLRRASDPTNYQILQNLPTDIPTLMEYVKLSKMPLYKRLNQLEKVGLIDWKKWTGELKSTEITDYVLESFKEMNKNIEKVLPELVERKYA